METKVLPEEPKWDLILNGKSSKNRKEIWENGAKKILQELEMKKEVK